MKRFLIFAMLGCLLFGLVGCVPMPIDQPENSVLTPTGEDPTKAGEQDPTPIVLEPATAPLDTPPEQLLEKPGMVAAMYQGNANMRAVLEEGWCWERVPLTDEGWFGLWIYAEAAPECGIQIRFYPNHGFGVCGTGLEEEEITISQYRAIAGYYDGRSEYSFAVFHDTPGQYVIWRGDRGFDPELSQAADRILRTMVLGEGIIHWREAIVLAEQAGHTLSNTKNILADYSYEDGTWRVRFFTNKGVTAQKQVILDNKGNVLSLEYDAPPLD